MKLNECLVFLSSSNAMTAQRNVVDEVVKELNENLGKLAGFHIALYRWEKDTTSSMGRPQDVIFSKSSFGDIDIYIGLIGNYLGVGTEEEFDAAYSSYIMTGTPEIMIFKDDSPIRANEIDYQKIERVQNFIADFNQGGKHPRLVNAFDDLKMLESKVRKSLTEYIFKTYLTGKKEQSYAGESDYLKRMASSGISNFYVGRDEWLLYRNPPRLADYLLTASKSVKIATYWLAQGTIEGVTSIYGKLLDKGVFVEVVTIAPTDEIATALAPDVNESAETVKTYVLLALSKLYALKSSLPEQKKKLFSVRTANTIPQAAAIMIDGDTENGRLQLEFRPFGMPRNDSFSIELSAGDDTALYNTLRESWTKFFDAASEYDSLCGN